MITEESTTSKSCALHTPVWSVGVVGRFLQIRVSKHTWLQCQCRHVDLCEHARLALRSTVRHCACSALSSRDLMSVR